MTTQQADFDFTAPPPRQSEVDAFTRHLRKNPGFHTAKELSKRLDLSDRKIRKLAECSDGQVVSGPGSPGYIHIDHCPAGTLAHIADTLRSQARSMLARSIRMRRMAHNLIR